MNKRITALILCAFASFGCVSKKEKTDEDLVTVDAYLVGYLVDDFAYDRTWLQKFESVEAAGSDKRGCAVFCITDNAASIFIHVDTPWGGVPIKNLPYKPNRIYRFQIEKGRLLVPYHGMNWTARGVEVGPTAQQIFPAVEKEREHLRKAESYVKQSRAMLVAASNEADRIKSVARLESATNQLPKVQRHLSELEEMYEEQLKNERSNNGVKKDGTK